MIDEKKLIEELENPINFETQCEITIGDIVGIIKKQPQADKCSDCSRRKFYQKGYQDGLNADKWIPCSERLPNVGDTVLFVDEYALYDVCTVLEDEGRKVLENSYGYWEDIADYIAWQPLPQPYKKEGAEC